MYKKQKIKAAMYKLTAGLIVAGCAAFSTGNASEIDYKPAWLVSGHCGHGNIDISVGGKKLRVSCASLDTHTGKGSYEKEVCYRVERGKHYDKHRHYSHYYDYDHYGYYKHCVVKKHYYQLPVIKIGKLAYDRHHKVIPADKSKSFDFQIHTNGGYAKSFHLKSKQAYYIIPPKDYYTITENAPYYKTSIDCGNGKVHGHSVNVKIDKPGKRVSCVFNNYKPRRHDHKPPKACVVKGHSIKDAKHNYAAHCHKPRRDCDLIGGTWDCSSHQIGHSAPAYTANSYRPAHRPAPKPKACVAGGHSIKDAKKAYAHYCSHKPRVDCDPVKGNWYCSSEQIGSNSPGLARW